ncbi:MAG: alpha-L-fucosidase, partial [Clostridiales bacterium]|nr:alpha-L-fucosidase [Clostridiales bacterium]
GMVITAKHHDGFCLWPSAHTAHSVASSPWRGGQGDVVREVADACRRHGLKFGFYLSPWDRNSPLYGTDAYNDYYKAQLTELLTGYGDVFIVWFDGACGEGPNGRRQVYDFPGYIELVRKYQPGAVIFNDAGPDVRWVGNEAGSARLSEWAVVPSELTPLADVQTGPGPWRGDLSTIYNTRPDIGSLASILYSQGLCFAGSEMDMSIRPGWFYHPDEQPHSLERLMRTYIGSVGHNACFHLNVPPRPDGRLDDADVMRLRELGEALRAAFGRDLAAGAKVETTRQGTQSLTTVTLAQPEALKHVVLMEDLSQGQRVESFAIEVDEGEAGWRTAFQGTTIGHKRICPITAHTGAFRVRVDAARGPVAWRSIAAHGA